MLLHPFYCFFSSNNQYLISMVSPKYHRPTIKSLRTCQLLRWFLSVSASVVRNFHFNNLITYSYTPPTHATIESESIVNGARGIRQCQTISLNCIFSLGTCACPSGPPDGQIILVIRKIDFMRYSLVLRKSDRYRSQVAAILRQDALFFPPVVTVCLGWSRPVGKGDKLVVLFGYRGNGVRGTSCGGVAN